MSPNRRTSWFLVAFPVVWLCFAWRAQAGEVAKPAPRIPWTTPFVTGSPEPPPKYKSVRMFPNVQFRNPVTIEMPPGDPRWWVSEPEAKLYVVTPTEDGGRADLIADFNRDLPMTGKEGEKLRVTYIYGVAFHPKFAENGRVYLAYTVVPPKPGVHLEDGTRVSCFQVTPGEIPKIDLQSEELVITFHEGGHNGACLEFGPDGCLYISTGDGGEASPPDQRNTGQDNSDLLSCILRINVDEKEPGRNYLVPKDNPFVDVPGVRPEIWAYGLRNPWKMSFDRATGALWVGDIGWELWEMVYRVERGANYGWSVTEGPQPVRVDLPAGPQPVTPPLLALPHTAAASITGGFVYRGKKFPELVGKYVFGDWETHRIWSLVPPERNDASDAKSLELMDLSAPSIRIIDFGQDHDGELVILDYDAGTIHTLERNDAAERGTRPFPRTLSETGLFASVEKHEVAAGIVPLKIAAEQWMDGATAERFVAVPNDGVIRGHRVAKQTPGSMFRRHFEFPKDSVLVKTISLPDEGTGERPRRIETQLLHFDGAQWLGYTYRWNDAQSEASLVPEEGDEAIFAVKDARAPGGGRVLHWTFSSRSQCMTCHTPWAESMLAFNSSQLLTPLAGEAGNRLDQFEQSGLLVRQEPAKAPPKNQSRWDEESVLVPPFDESHSIEHRARSYLDANCAHCHRFGGGGTAQIDLRAGIPVERTKLLDEVPTKGELGLKNAKIVWPGNPYRSVLFLRMATCGRGRMPHLASELVDQQGLLLIEAWIRLMSKEPGGDEFMYNAVLSATAKMQGREARRGLLAPILNDLGGTLYLARVLDRGRLRGELAEDVVALIGEQSDPDIRNLFAAHLPAPPADRVGTVPRPRLVLNLTGDPARGRELYQTSKTLNCRVCHRIGNEGGVVGPELTQIGQRRRRDELLDSLLNPSSVVDPKFAMYAVQTVDGRVLSGVLAERNANALTLRDAKGDVHEFAVKEVEELKPQRASIMPEGLLKDLTLQEAADLVAYLESLR
ncbi:Soluble aldose sugar dehydrogenase YliI precursor [Caulifigura coniformis]|uniref:Soluble aldose sugar dehydrogenase YliI n=1 Tax=Caulifigura coniformis TaxID=2527983 RepID=A0A517SAQ3_9PLAN|nr:PQQ-dependent sugar dehydrogenase [Caulifigura coniformis]QDT53205.1 Soluble aldose sugar dehydrogenase YliI precursor [Caulifigura coniformis]